MTEEVMRENTAETDGCGCCDRKKVRSEKEYRDLMNRLSRIEGQIRGIKGMLEKDAYCISGVGSQLCAQQFYESAPCQPHQILRGRGRQGGRRGKAGRVGEDAAEADEVKIGEISLKVNFQTLIGGSDDHASIVT